MKTTKRMPSRWMAIAMLGFIMMLAVEASPQIIENKKGSFTSIPSEERAKLSERLELFVKAQSERRWSDVYDLSLDAVHGSMTSAAFVKEYENGFPNRHVFDLLSFTPTSATLVNINGDAKEWLVEGCAQYRERGKIVYQQAGLNAGLYGGQWYFSYLSESTRGVDGPTLPCNQRSTPRIPGLVAGTYLGSSSSTVARQLSAQRIVSFEVDGRPVEKKFKIRLYVGNRVIEPKMRGNSFIVPASVREQESVGVRFLCGKYDLLFDNVAASSFDVDWRIGVDHKPFKQEYVEPETVDKLRVLYYITFVPKDADGTRLVVQSL